MLALALGALAVFFVFGFFGLPLWAWTVAAAALLFGLTANPVAWGVLIVIAAILNVPVLRRRLLTDRILAAYRRILPDMSQTEKEAIDAGTVWWDGELFSGKPDWDKLLRTPQPRLSPEEQAFLDAPVEELCAMCDDWEITHERQDLPPQRSEERRVGKERR